MNTSGKSAVATSFKGDGYEPDVVEHTITMDISTLNITGYLCMEFIDISEYGGLGLGRYNTTSYILNGQNNLLHGLSRCHMQKS